MLPFVIKYEKFLEKFDSVWNKISNIIGMKFDKMQIYGKKYLNTTFKFCSSKINLYQCLDIMDALCNMGCTIIWVCHVI